MTGFGLVAGLVAVPAFASALVAPALAALMVLPMPVPGAGLLAAAGLM